MFFFLLSVVSLSRAAVDRLVGENKIVLFMKVRRRLPHHFPLPKNKNKKKNGRAQTDELSLSLAHRSLLCSRPQGTKMFPQCGFSNTCVQIFNQLGAPFEDVNVLEDERIRTGMKEYSQWPTFPQVYIEGEFYGGCDILLESYQSGELEEYVERVLAS